MKDSREDQQKTVFTRSRGGAEEERSDGGGSSGSRKGAKIAKEDLFFATLAPLREPWLSAFPSSLLRGFA